MAFFIPSIQVFFGLPRALFCFGIHFNTILGSLSSAYLRSILILYYRLYRFLPNGLFSRDSFITTV